MTIYSQRLKTFLRGLPSDATLVIWGRGEISDIAQSAIQKDFAEMSVLGLTDSSYGGEQVVQKNGLLLAPSDNLLMLRPDAIIIASIRYTSEIVSLLKEKGASGKVFTHEYGVSDAKRHAADLLKKRDKHALVSLLFEYPEQAFIWEALAKLNPEKQESESFCQSAENLKTTGD